MRKMKNPEMNMQFYKPETSVTGPAYSLWFKCLATTVTLLLAAYGLRVVSNFPLMQYGFGIKALLAGSAVMLLVSYYWFLKSTITIDATGITQTWMYNRQVAWRDVRSAKMIGIPYPGIAKFFRRGWWCAPAMPTRRLTADRKRCWSSSPRSRWRSR